MTTTTKLKALSFYQPYAWMMANGHIDIDDRTWPTNYRGLVALHASKTFEPNFYLYVKYMLGIDIPEPEDLPTGGIVAIGTLVHCLSPGEPSSIPPERRAHGGGHCYGLLFENIYPVEFIPMRGRQGLFEIELTAEQLRPFIPAPAQPDLFAK